MTTLKTFILSLMMVGSAIFSNATADFSAPMGGAVDVLQVGRNAVVVQIDRSQLPSDIQVQIAIVVVSGPGTHFSLKCDNSVAVPTGGLSAGTYTVTVTIGTSFEEADGFTL